MAPPEVLKAFGGAFFMGQMKKIKEYETYLFQKELSEGTREIYMRQAQGLMHFLAGSPITKEGVIAYKEHLSHIGLAVSTMNVYIVAVNSYLRYAGYEECTVKTKRVQRRKSLENVISIAEYHRLLRYARESGRDKYYYIMRTLALTGIRIGELKYFTVEILDKEVIQVNNKGKYREIYLSDELREELKEYCRENRIGSGVIFTGKQDLPISRVGVYKMLIRIADQAGVPREKVHPHSFRHMFALAYMNRYKDITELSDILGHSSLETTRIYTLTSIQEKREKISHLGL